MMLANDHIQWDSLVDRQVRLWQEKLKTPPISEQESHDPWETAHITISRNYGARGYRIGEIVAQKLRWQVYSRELVEYIAKSSNLRDKVIAEFDEKHHSRTLSQTLFEPSSYSSDKHYRYLIQLISSLAKHGQAVIIGRGANFITDPQKGLHVRVTASLESRIVRYAGKQKISFREARKKVAAVDRERADFVKSHFHRDVDDPHNYDLVLNVERLDNEQAADIIIAALQVKIAHARPLLMPEKSLLLQHA